jgi:hypothetical protein
MNMMMMMMMIMNARIIKRDKVEEKGNMKKTRGGKEGRRAMTETRKKMKGEYDKGEIRRRDREA